jgi:hypothetical protein
MDVFGMAAKNAIEDLKVRGNFGIAKLGKIF